jgi:carbonyl reductase 1
MTSRNESAGREACHALQGEGLGVSWFALDVCSAESIAALVTHLKAKHGVIDVLVNNAGIVMEGFDGDVARDTIETNFFGALSVTDALLPLLADNARVAMVSSGMGDRSCMSSSLRERFMQPMDRETLVGLMNKFVEDVANGRHSAEGWPSSAYRTSKIGINKLVEVLAAELEGDPRHLMINAACPGWVQTRMGGPSAPRTVEQGAQTPVWLAMLEPGGPTGGFFRDDQRADW